MGIDSIARSIPDEEIIVDDSHRISPYISRLWLVRSVRRAPSSSIPAADHLNRQSLERGRFESADTKIRRAERDRVVHLMSDACRV